MAEDAASLNKRRATIKGQLTRIYNYVSSLAVDLVDLADISECQARVQKVKDLWSEFDVIQSKIEDFDASEAQLQERTIFESGYYRTLAEITKRTNPRQERLVVENPRQAEANRLEGIGMSHQERVKLPTLDLPKFDGTYSQWLLFRDTFQALIENNTALENIQKFYYLKSCLLGNAAQLLQSLEMSADNYQIAWDLLRSRFENKRLLIHHHIQGLFEVSPLTKESATQLRKLIDDTQKHLRALKTLGEPVDNWDSLIIHMIASRLDNASRRKWEASLQDNNVPKLKEFIQFLSKQCAILETLQSEKATIKHQPSIIPNKGVAVHVGQGESKGCIVCQGLHALYSCTTFKGMSVCDRRKEVKRHQLCFNCLRADHMVNRCLASGCKQCGRKHNTLLHEEDFKLKTVAANEREKPEASLKKSISNLAIAESNRTDSSATYSVVSAQSRCNQQVLLATAPVVIYDKYCKPHQCRAFLDAGSQTNIITINLCRRLKLDTQESSIFLSGIGCGQVNTLGSVHAVIHSTVNEFKIKLPFLIMDRITEPMPAIKVDKTLLRIPENINIADASFGTPEDVDILLGSGVFWDLLCIGQVKLGRNLPVLQKTKLGWIIAGSAPTVPGQEASKKTVLSTIVKETELSQQLERFWKLEECLPKANFSKEDEQCEEDFRDTFQRDPSGRFVVKFSFQEDPSVLGDSKEIALKRLRSLHRRLESKPDLKAQYVSCLDEYLSLGHMVKADEKINHASHYYHYLPHHAVIKEDSTTTRLRVVFDASSKTSSGKSLNDILRKGPVIQPEGYVILVRFRKHPYVLTGDAEKMYRQIYVHEEHRGLLRILWMEDPTAPVEEFVLTILAFGLTQAPYLAIRCLEELGFECQVILPDISRIILEDFYIDDMITGADNIDQLKRIKSKISEVLSSGGFKMRKWKSNVSELTGDETADEHSLGERVKTLGLYWQPSDDTLSYKVSMSDMRRVTKRSILSFIAHIYDPLGLIGPICVQAKIILQRLWQIKIDWDESLPVDLHSTWLRYYESLSSLQEIVIPRLILDVNFTRLEIHGFCDASEQAYGACLYLLSDNNGKRTCQLICAKSKVAPLKKVSLPKLELCGAELLAGLMDKTVQALDLPIQKKYCWCDSTIVLAWIKGEPSRWKTFVANRVSKIQGLSRGSQWGHIKSQENPADMLSRGVQPEVLKSRQLWWNGPPWLVEEGGDSYSTSPELPKEIPEEKSRITVCTIVEQEDQQDQLLNRYSSLKRLKCVVAYCLRFLYNCKEPNDRRTGFLSVIELKNATRVIVKIHQNQHFSREILALKQKRPIFDKSRLLCLDPFMDTDEIVRVGGRLRNSQLSYAQKFPILLASHDHLTELIIREAHLKNLHAGAETLLSILREQYWIISGRSTIRKVLHKCLTCYRFNCKSPLEIMGDLPKSRVTPSRAFSSVGVDYAGPFTIRISRNKNAKAYLCLFVCLVTRAIHLELVSDLSTKAFLNSLRRFIARRGKCANIYSDQGTNFVGANNELQALARLLQNSEHQRQVNEFLAEQAIQWHFLPPYSPHMGGIWEAGIKSAKTRLKKVLGGVNPPLTFEELYTLITEIEACLNSRPLTPMSNDPSDLTALTPGHFLIGTPLTAVPQLDLSDVPINRLTRYQLLIHLQQHFWSRWSAEYLTQLQVRRKWKKTIPEDAKIKIDMLVVLKDDHLPPLKWKLGRIVEVHPDKNGRVRVVSVKTTDGIVKRSLPKICILPVS